MVDAAQEDLNGLAFTTEIDPMPTRSTNIVELLAEWKQEGPLGPDDEFPDIQDVPAEPEDIR